MKISIIVGTRPEIIKMSPVIRRCQKQRMDYFTVHTGQHYSYSLDKVFFNELELPLPKYNLDVGSGTHAQVTGKTIIKIETVLRKEEPDYVLVEGDTNSVLGSALTAAKLNIKIGHVEAGLRSYDKNMPEEINRVLTDHISDLLFAPTKTARKNLLKEGINHTKIFITGNTIVDAIYQNLKIVEKKKRTLNELDLTSKEYLLITSHRQENVDVKNRLKNILNGLDLIYQELGFPILYPIHPRAKKRIKEFHLKIPKGTIVIEPVSFLEFLQLETNALLVLTDSGGVQEETCILKIPCVTLRDNTERPETLIVGSNTLVGTDAENILEGVKTMVNKKGNWTNPFGDGSAGRKIIKIIEKDFGEDI